MQELQGVFLFGYFVNIALGEIVNCENVCYNIILIVLIINIECASEVMRMIKNNIEVDVKVKCIEAGKTQAQLGEAIGTTGQYVNRIIKKQDGVVNKTFVQMLEALGYDIELTYVKRANNSNDSK